MSACQIYNNSQFQIDDEIHNLVNFTKQRLGFKKPPTIFLNDDSDNSEKTLAKTGYYDPSTMEIHIFTTGRHPKDILRSIAHELVHHNQNENGQFQNSGYSGKGYAQKNPHLRKMELQANDPMLFRDWEDSLKEKYPTIYNERRTLKMSTKDWKNKELSENLNKKWGFKMDLTKLNENKEVEEAHCNEDEEEKLEEKKGDCPECKNAKEDCVCPDKKKKMEEDKMPMKDEPKGKDLNKDGKKGHGKVPAFLGDDDKSDQKEDDDGKKKFKPKKGEIPPQFKKKK